MALNWRKFTTLMGLLLATFVDAQGAQAGSPEPLVLREGASVSTIAPHFSWYYDASGKETITDVLAKAPSAFQSYGTVAIPFLYAFQPYWIRFSLRNESAETRWFVSSLAAIMENVEIYEVGPGPSWSKLDLMPSSRTATAATTLSIGDTKDYLIRFRTYDPPSSSLFSVLDVKALRERDTAELQFFGTIFGIFFAIILYNAFLYASLRRKVYLFYLMFATANAFIALCVVNVPIGLSHLFSPIEWGHALRFLAPLTTILFAKVFLETRERCRRVNFALNSLLTIYGGLLILRFVTGDQTPLNQVVDILMSMGIILLLAAALISWRGGNASAKYFLLGMGTFFLSIIIMTVYPFLGLPANMYATSAHLIGQTIEMVLMSLALASLIKSLEEKKVRAEATALTKSKLLRVMSHDIMNPLALIKGFAQMMQRKPAETEHIEKIARSASIIENIVHFVVKYESARGARPLQLAPVAMKDVVEDLHFLFQDALAEKGIDLTFELQPANVSVLAEKISLTNEILANLLSNAIKFSFVGSSVEVKALARGEHVVITVRDHGIGIPKEALARIFDSTQNMPRQGTGGELGAGFGMPIVWSFVRELGGEIDVESVAFAADQQSAGTTVTIILKRAHVV